MKPLVSILIPTHDHADTLYASVKSALAQSVSDLELFIIGDGVPDATRTIANELMADSRVQFVDRPKSPRHGEPYRHEVLQELAQGKYVFYLSDDDLYFPDHVEHMLGVLDGADFANALPLVLDSGQFRTFAVDMSQDSNYKVIAHGLTGRFGLSYVAHTMEFYRRLPRGWHTTPGTIATDQYMWRQCLAVPGCRAVSSFYPTVLRFPAPSRKGIPPAERLAEMMEWLPRLLDSHDRAQLRHACLEHALRSAAQEMAESTIKIAELLEELSSARHIAQPMLQNELTELRALVQEQQAQLEVWRQSHAVQEETARNWRLSHEHLQTRLASIERSRLWRVVSRLRATPLASALIDSATRLFSHEGHRRPLEESRSTARNARSN